MRALTGAAEVYNLDLTPPRVDEQDVLRLEVAVDDRELLGGEELKSCAQLMSKLSCQIQRNSFEVSVSDEVVKVVREEFEDEAEVTQLIGGRTLAHEVAVHVNDATLLVRVIGSDEFEKVYLNARLIQKRLLVLYHLHCHLFIHHSVPRS